MKLISEQKIEAIQTSHYEACLVLTGGGSAALHALLAHAGASRFILDAQIPYNPNALASYLKHSPQSACSEQTAKQLAQAALKLAQNLQNDDSSNQPLGIACTAALQTNRTRKGADRAFIAFQTL